ncbi:hypothetical protein J6590_101404 [Homalodisca vitripennis]|nr:hypothetical protein J6590_101404 [Homalodisca vitripennis]
MSERCEVVLYSSAATIPIKEIYITKGTFYNATVENTLRGWEAQQWPCKSK